MCGRFALATDKKSLELLYEMELRLDFSPRYNIAPSQEVLVLRLFPGSGKRELVPLRWGLVPFWADSPSSGSRMINARSETAPEKPSFRTAFKKRRALIPASGFFEWKIEGGKKQPYYVCRRDNLPFSLAGLWERWEKGQMPLETCTILTTEPNDLLASIHNRMPVIIPVKNYRTWLDPSADKDTLTTLLEPFPEEVLTAFPVSTLVNKPGNDNPEILRPLA